MQQIEAFTMQWLSGSNLFVSSEQLLDRLDPHRGQYVKVLCPKTHPER